MRVVWVMGWVWLLALAGCQDDGRSPSAGGPPPGASPAEGRSGAATATYARKNFPDQAKACRSTERPTSYRRGDP